MKRWLGLLIGLAAIALPAQAVDTADDVQRFTLKNGMTFLVLEDHSIPNANMYLFWRVGSRNEYPGITGLSHFFEHMMFNGAKRYGPKQFDRTMEAAGGSNNAYTTEDVTVYTDWFPSSSVETIFELEADRIADLAIDPKMVASERGVVTAERRTGLENSNFRMLYEELKGVAYRAHPYSWSVIGHASDIENWSQTDLETYHKTYYAPNNAVVVMVGDVTLQQVKTLAKQYFEPIPAQEPPRKVHTVEPEQKGERRTYVQKPSATSVNMAFAYHVPNTEHQDYYPLSVLSDVLSSGKTSRLYQALVDEQQLAMDVYSFVGESFDPSLFTIYAVARPGVTADKLEAAMKQVVADVAKNGVTAQELAKVKKAAKMNLYQTLATINGKANNLGSYEVFHGDYRKLFSFPDDIEAVTAEDVQRVAQTYLKKSNRSVGILAAEEDKD